MALGLVTTEIPPQGTEQLLFAYLSCLLQLRRLLQDANLTYFADNTWQKVCPAENGDISKFHPQLVQLFLVCLATLFTLMLTGLKQLQGLYHTERQFPKSGRMPKRNAQPSEWEQNQNEQIQPVYGQMRKNHQLKAAQIPSKLGAYSKKDISNQQWISVQQLNQSAT